MVRPLPVRAYVTRRAEDGQLPEEAPAHDDREDDNPREDGDRQDNDRDDADAPGHDGADHHGSADDDDHGHDNDHVDERRAAVSRQERSPAPAGLLRSVL